MDEAAPDIESLSFEQALKELESIVSRLESGDAALQEAIDLYERGDKLRAQCAARLDAAQMRIEQVKTDAQGRASGTQPFQAG
jgi:exodeoxyribonuclease VII small subunit